MQKWVNNGLKSIPLLLTAARGACMDRLVDCATLLQETMTYGWNIQGSGRSLLPPLSVQNISEKSLSDWCFTCPPVTPFTCPAATDLTLEPAICRVRHHTGMDHLLAFLWICWVFLVASRLSGRNGCYSLIVGFDEKEHQYTVCAEFKPNKGTPAMKDTTFCTQSTLLLEIMVLIICYINQKKCWQFCM